MIATTTIPEWTAFVIAIASLIAALGGIIAAIRSHQTYTNSKIPSNGIALGALVEAIGQVLHLKIQLDHPEVSSPAPSAVAKNLEAGQTPEQAMTNATPTPPVAP